MPNPNIFSFFTYANNFTTMLRDAFPSLQEVSFPPTAEGFTESRFSDVALPAFLVNFEDPELMAGQMQSLRSGEELDGDGELYFMQLKINLAGYLLMPVFAEANTVVPNVNPTVLLAQVVANLTAKINACAWGEGWNCSRPSMNQLNFIDDSIVEVERNYHVAELHWSHEVWIGSEPGVTAFDPMTVYNRFTIPIDGDTPDESYEVYPDRGEPEP